MALAFCAIWLAVAALTRYSSLAALMAAAATPCLLVLNGERGIAALFLLFTGLLYWWRQFNKRVGDSGDVGIWHETYRVSTARIETIYGNMPPHGLAAATGLVPIPRGRDSAAARIGAADTDEPALPPY